MKLHYEDACRELTEREVDRLSRIFHGDFECTCIEEGKNELRIICKGEIKRNSKTEKISYSAIYRKGGNAWRRKDWSIVGGSITPEELRE